MSGALVAVILEGDGDVSVRAETAEGDEFEVLADDFDFAWRSVGDQVRVWLDLPPVMAEELPEPETYAESLDELEPGQVPYVDPPTYRFMDDAEPTDHEKALYYAETGRLPDDASDDDEEAHRHD